MTITAVWGLALAANAGLLSWLWPNSIVWHNGELYVVAWRGVDWLATASLLTWVGAAVIMAKGRAARPPVSDGEGVRRPSRQHRERRMRITPAVAAIFLAALSGVSVGLTIHRTESGRRVSSAFLRADVLISRRGSLAAAVEALTRRVSTSYLPGRYAEYFFASGWEGDLGNWAAALPYDMDLLHASVIDHNPYGIAVAEVQLAEENWKALPSSLRHSEIQLASPLSWRRLVSALLSWRFDGSKVVALDGIDHALRSATGIQRTLLMQAAKTLSAPREYGH